MPIRRTRPIASCGRLPGTNVAVVTRTWDLPAHVADVVEDDCTPPLDPARPLAADRKRLLGRRNERASRSAKSALGRVLDAADAARFLSTSAASASFGSVFRRCDELHLHARRGRERSGLGHFTMRDHTSSSVGMCEWRA